MNDQIYLYLPTFENRSSIGNNNNNNNHNHNTITEMPTTATTATAPSWEPTVSDNLPNEVVTCLRNARFVLLTDLHPHEI